MRRSSSRFEGRCECFYEVYDGLEPTQRARDYEPILREVLMRNPVLVSLVVVDMVFGGMSSRPVAIYRTLQDVQRARAAYGLRGKLRIWTA